MKRILEREKEKARTKGSLMIVIFLESDDDEKEIFILLHASFAAFLTHQK